MLALVNITLMIFLKLDIKKILKSTLKIMPFIIFTFLINIVLDEFTNAIYIGIKLIIVCNITIIYSNTITVMELAETIKKLCKPLKILGVNANDIELLVAISLLMIPILKKELFEVKDACRAKNIDFNIKNSKYIFTKYFLSLIRKVNQIEESLVSRGY